MAEAATHDQHSHLEEGSESIVKEAKRLYGHLIVKHFSMRVKTNFPRLQQTIN